MGNDFRDLFGEWHPDDEGHPSAEGRPHIPGDSSREHVREVRVVNVYEARNELIDPGEGNGTSSFFVLLRDNLGREFRIFVLRDVAVAIAMAVDNELPDRPFTHDLMKNMIEKLGAKVERVTIDDLWQDTFYAKIGLVKGSESFEIDARPSDAIAIGLRFRAPIYVSDAVMESAQHQN